jgi:hypothetical protein
MKKHPKTPAIDLSKCKIGQKLKMRNGGIATLTGVESPIKDDQPFMVSHPEVLDPFWYTAKGRFYSTGISEFDIVAILPLPKKKVKAIKEKRPFLKSLDEVAERKIKDGIGEDLQTISIKRGDIRKLINLLEGLLKP